MATHQLDKYTKVSDRRLYLENSLSSLVYDSVVLWEGHRKDIKSQCQRDQEAHFLLSQSSAKSRHSGFDLAQWRTSDTSGRAQEASISKAISWTKSLRLFSALLKAGSLFWNPVHGVSCSALPGLYIPKVIRASSASQLKIFLPNVYIIFTPCNGDGAGDGSGGGCVCPDPLEQQL